MASRSRLDDYPNNNKTTRITNKSSHQSYNEVRELPVTTKATTEDESRSKQKRNHEASDGMRRLELLEDTPNGKSKERQHSRYKNSDNDGDCDGDIESDSESSSTFSESAYGRKTVRSRKSLPSSLDGYTHSEVESKISRLIWSGRPAQSAKSLAGVHTDDCDALYYGYNITNSTGRNLWWDEIADSLLSNQILKPQKRTGAREGYSLTKHNDNLMLDRVIPSSRHQNTSFMVMPLFNLGNQCTGHPGSGVHEKRKVKIYKILDFPISIRNRLGIDISWDGTKSELDRILTEQPQYQNKWRENPGIIWELVLGKDRGYLTIPRDRRTRIVINICVPANRKAHSYAIPIHVPGQHRSTSSGQHSHRAVETNRHPDSSGNSQRSSLKEIRGAKPQTSRPSSNRASNSPKEKERENRYNPSHILQDTDISGPSESSIQKKKGKRFQRLREKVRERVKEKVPEKVQEKAQWVKPSYRRMRYRKRKAEKHENWERKMAEKGKSALVSDGKEGLRESSAYRGNYYYA